VKTNRYLNNFLLSAQRVLPSDNIRQCMANKCPPYLGRSLFPLFIRENIDIESWKAPDFSDKTLNKPPLQADAVTLVLTFNH